MSPLEIEALLQYHYAGGKPTINCSEKHLENIIGYLHDENLIQKRNKTVFKNDHPYMISDRGSNYVNQIINLPLPVQVWVHPDKAKELNTNEHS